MNEVVARRDRRANGSLWRLDYLAVAFSSLVYGACAMADCDRAASGPPDAETVQADGAGVISAAFVEATDIYRHGVLGDAVEAAALRVKSPETVGECGRIVRLDPDSVFEDVTPRIADVTGDGLNDVVTIETHVELGASLAIYGFKGSRFGKLAATPYIGTAFRWLAPVGIADFDGDDVADVAYVQTPHIGGILRIWSFAGGVAREIALLPGFSNHRIGDNFTVGGVRNCGGVPQLLLPDNNWQRIQQVWMQEGSLQKKTVLDEFDAQWLLEALRC